MKLIIQIPCLNEEACSRRRSPTCPGGRGVSRVEWLVIDDGSSDRTAEVARRHGVDHVVRLTSNKGLAVAFQAGIDAALKLGADVIVNTDADNQYQGSDIAKLVAPIVRGDADMVVGARDIRGHGDFSPTKKVLQRWGSWIVRHASNTDVPDATSGFRAYTRSAAMRLNVVSPFTYTLETIIQAGRSDLAVTHVPIGVNAKTRDSRLFRSIPQYVTRSMGTILRIYAMYEPIKFFLTAAAIVALPGLFLIGRFVVLYLTDAGPTGHVQSVVIGGVLLILSFQCAVLAVVGDLLRANRVISERTLQRVRGVELTLGVEPENLLRGPEHHVGAGRG